LPFPVLVVFSGGSSAPAAAITEISWKALRCNFEAGGAIAGMKADLRRDAAGTRLLVEDDDLEELAAVAVLISRDGRGVIGQRLNRVGGDPRAARDRKTHLSEWLGRVQAGEVVEVTSHRSPIARIAAVRQPDPASPRYQERCHPSYSQTRGLDGAEQCVVTARRSRLMSEGG
jgi:antitoxin (DNA-binding transcriptional repressor) of toxin-antitoxin stability system